MYRTKSPWVRRNAKGGGWELKKRVKLASWGVPVGMQEKYWQNSCAARVIRRKRDAWQMFILDDIQHPRCIGEKPTKALAMAVCEAVVALEAP